MATFNAEVLLNTRVNQNSVNKAIRSITQVQALVSKLKPINLFAPGSGAGPDKIRTELEKIVKVAKQINSGQTGKGGIASTFAGANDQARAFLETLKNVNLKAKDGTSKAKINELAQAFVRADKEATEYEKTLNDIIRKARGLQPQAIRDEEVRKRKARRKRLRAEKKAEKDAADARIKEQKRADREVERSRKKLARQAKQEEKERKRRNELRRNNIGAAAGFPLLFGGGVGSVIGGVTGALFGGFGGSILGSALGQQFDKLGAAALNTAKAFDNVTENLDAVLKKLGESNTSIGQRASFAASQGLSNQAAEAIRLRSEEVLGRREVLRLRELAESAKEFDKSLERLGLKIQQLVGGPLKALIDLIAGPAEKAQPTAEQEALGAIKLKQSDIKAIELLDKLAKKRGSTLSPELQQRLKVLKEELAVLKEQALTVEGKTEAERQLLKITRDRLNLARELASAEVSIAERSLTERRDVLAADRGALAVREAEAEVNRIRAEIAANKANAEPGFIQRDLELQLQLTEAIKKANLARANASNSVLIAERQITKETQAQLVQAAQLNNQRVRTRLALLDLNKGTVENFEERRKGLLAVQESERAILDLQQKQELVGVREGELKNEIIRKQKVQKGLLEDTQQLQLRRSDADQAARLDRRKAIEDTRTIKTLEAEINAERLKRSTNPAYMMSFATAGFGFFSDSAKLEADQIADRTAQLELYNEQLAKLKQRRAEAVNKVSGNKLFELDTEIKDLETLRNNFERLQPEIDAAALAQARFNDAFNAVSPAVNSLVNGLKEVVAGTKSAEEAFADFLNTIADQLVQTAATMIAQYIAIGIARSFAGIPGPKTPTNPGGGTALGGSLAGGATGITPIPVIPFAEGGYVTRPTRAVIGEGGEPEYVIPASKMNESMARYSGGNRGNEVVPNNATGGGNSPTSSGGAPLFDLQTTVINNVEYATVEDVRAMGARATSAGAKQGEARVMSSLKNSRSMRSRVGI